MPASLPPRPSLEWLRKTAKDRLVQLRTRQNTAKLADAQLAAMSRLGPRGQRLVQHLVSRGVAAKPQDYARMGDRDRLARLVGDDPDVAKLDAVMMAAVDFSHHELVKWLVERGANVNARSDAESRHTALHSAAWNGDVEMVRLLLDAGADPSLRDEQYDSTPLGWAETSIHVSNNPRCAEVVELLQDRGKTGSVDDGSC